MKCVIVFCFDCLCSLIFIIEIMFLDFPICSILVHLVCFWLVGTCGYCLEREVRCWANLSFKRFSSCLANINFVALWAFYSVRVVLWYYKFWYLAEDNIVYFVRDVSVCVFKDSLLVTVPSFVRIVYVCVIKNQKHIKDLKLTCEKT